MSSLTTTDCPIVLLSPGATELAIVADRVKLFNVAQQRLSADITQNLTKSNAADVYTCAAWGLQKKGGRLLLVGTQAGEIKCFDTARAELLWAAAGALDGPVASLSCSSAEAGAVLAVGRTGGAAVLDPASGKVSGKFQASKHQVSAAASLPGDVALVAGSGVQLLDCATGARLHKFTGHANPVLAVAVTPNGRFIATAAEGERSVAVWNATPSKSGKRKHKSAVAQLGLETAATQLAVAAGGSSAGAFQVAALTQGGTVWLFQCSPAAEGPGLEASLWGKSAAGGAPVLAVGLEAADDAGVSLVMVTGSTARPAFQHVRVDRGGGAGEVAHFVVEHDQGGALVGQKVAGASTPEGGKASKGERAAPVAVVDAGAGALLASKLTGTKRGAEQEEEDGEEVAEQQEEDSRGAEGPTFAERLAALQLDQGPPVSAAKKDAAPPIPAGPLKADSLSVLLGQALQSGDRALLERCLTVRNEDMIRKTASRLSAGEAALFLRAAVQRLQSAHSRGEQLAAWVRAVLLAHAGSLVAMAGMQPTLAYLYQLVEARLASYQPLLSLAGRLDVVLAHAQRSVGAGAEAPAGAADGPLVVVEVGSDDAIEVEDTFAAVNGVGSDDEGSEDESEWEEDEGDEGLAGLGGGGSEDEDLEGAGESEEDE